MTWTNQTKDPTTFTNEVPSSQTNLTWDQATFTWTQAGDATWNEPGRVWINASKDTSAFTNQTKH